MLVGGVERTTHYLSNTYVPPPQPPYHSMSIYIYNNCNHTIISYSYRRSYKAA